jgi:hypothetical protein
MASPSSPVRAQIRRAIGTELITLSRTLDPG